MGEPLEPHPGWGWRYEPVSEGELEGSALRLSAVEWMRGQMDRGPSHPARVLPAMSLSEGDQPPAEAGSPANSYDRLTRVLAGVVQAEMLRLSVELAATEAAAGAVPALHHSAFG